MDDRNLEGILVITKDLLATHDLDLLLDKILLEARKFTRADAGSIFLVRGDRLVFSYVHNDSLFRDKPQTKYVFAQFELPIDENSLAGYAALHGRSMMIDDVYQIPATDPYTFNRDFDLSSGYRTKSMLVVPLQTSQGKVVGVLQIINARDASGNVIGFSEKDRSYVTFFGDNAAIAIERATLTRELIMRTIRMARLRDPRETGAHANRVGAFSSEIYQRWAERRGIGGEESRKNSDLIRVAAMLHDVGKVAISDVILQKPGRLTPDEYHRIKFHTIFGAQLFSHPASDLDIMSQLIALNHHERWDGRGYPGHVPDLEADEVSLGPGKKGEEIPWCARIVGLADVYDALMSRRTYKEPWPEEMVLATIRENSGRHFDPEVVDIFFELYDVIRAARSRYKEEES